MCAGFNELGLGHLRTFSFCSSPVDKVTQTRCITRLSINVSVCLRHRAGVCVYLIIEDNHDKYTKQHRLHQQDDVVSTEIERERENSGVEMTLIEYNSLFTEKCK